MMQNRRPQTNGPSNAAINVSSIDNLNAGDAPAAPSVAMVNAACTEIMARWRRAGLSEDAALEQAERFAKRVASIDAAAAYNAELAAVAEAMR